MAAVLVVVAGTCNGTGKAVRRDGLLGSSLWLDQRLGLLLWHCGWKLQVRPWRAAQWHMNSAQQLSSEHGCL